MIDNRDIRQKIADAAWRPVRKKSEHPLDPKIEEAELAERKRIKDERFGKMSTEQRIATYYREQKAKDEQAAADELTRQEHLGQPEVIYKLAYLNKLKTEIESRDDATISEHLAVVRAIQQAECIDGCPTTTEAMFQSIRDAENERIARKDAALDAEIERLQALRTPKPSKPSLIEFARDNGWLDSSSYVDPADVRKAYDAKYGEPKESESEAADE